MAADSASLLRTGLGIVLANFFRQFWPFRLVLELSLPDGGRIMKLPDGSISIDNELPASRMLLRAKEE